MNVTGYHGRLFGIDLSSIRQGPDSRNGGEGWIRTSVRLRGQIYSLLPLTTRPPLQVVATRSQSAGPPTMASRRAMWRRGFRLSTRSNQQCARRPRFARAHHARLFPGQAVRGAGEGNRTLVVSLEGFCSTIELHPPVGADGLNAIGDNRASIVRRVLTPPPADRRWSPDTIETIFRRPRHRRLTRRRDLHRGIQAGGLLRCRPRLSPAVTRRSP